MSPIKIKLLGGYYPMDSNGFIINDASFEKVDKSWLPILDEIIEAYQKELGEEIHSIYLRGSIARGKEVKGLSDIDTLALIRQPDIRWQKPNGQLAFEKKLQTSYSQVKEVEMMLSSYHANMFEANPRLSMILKTQSICVFGESVLPGIPNFKPSKSMMLNYRWIEKEVNEFLEKSTPSERDIQEVMKIMIRTGFELVMERLGKYTTDLYWSYDAFSKFYPNRAEEMEKALFFYLNPSTKETTIPILVKELGIWLSKEVENELKI